MAAVGSLPPKTYAPAAAGAPIPLRSLLGEGADFWIDLKEGRFKEAACWLDSLKGSRDEWVEFGRKVREAWNVERSDESSLFLERLFVRLLEHDLILAAQVASLTQRNDLLSDISAKFLKLESFEEARHIFSEIRKEFPGASAFYFFHMLTRLVELALPAEQVGELCSILRPFDPHLLDWVRAAFRNEYARYGHHELAKKQDDQIIDPRWKKQSSPIQ